MDKRIILNSDEVVTCPDCDHAFALYEGITRQTIERYEQEFDAALGEERKVLQASLEKDARRQAEKQFQGQLAELREQLEEGLAAREKMKDQLNEAREKAAAGARAEAEAEASQLKEELLARDEKLAEYRQQEMDLRREKRALEDARKEQDLELQLRFSVLYNLVHQYSIGDQ